jgi:glycosyltransferase involved in cell wall biosynthesis
LTLKTPEKILFLRSNPVSPDPRVEKEADALVSAGYPVSILCWDRTAGLPPFEEKNRVPIYRLPIQAGYGTGIQNLPALLRWQWGLLKWLIRHRNEFDILHACDFDTVIPAMLLKWIWGKKVVYDIFDFYADHLRSTPDWVKRLILIVDKWMIGRTDALILVDDSRWEQITGSSPKRSAVIYNSPPDIVGTGSTEFTRSSNDILKLVYVGLLQVERGLFELLDVLDRHPEWSLDLAGFGGDEAKIISLAEKLPNVNWHGRISYQQAMELSAASDVFLASYDPSIPNHRFSSPNKVFEAMMFGKPIIVARHTNMDKIIDQHGCGIVVDYGVVDQLEDALTSLERNPELRSQMGKNARQAYEEEFQWSEMAARLIALYESILES